MKLRKRLRQMGQSKFIRHVQNQMLENGQTNETKWVQRARLEIERSMTCKTMNHDVPRSTLQAFVSGKKVVV